MNNIFFKFLFLKLNIIIFLFSTQILALDVSFSGQVFDQNGKPVIGSKITIQELKLTQITRKDGSYGFLHLKPGIYNVIITAVSFETQITKIELGSADLHLDFTLNSSLLEKQGINVTSKSSSSEFLNSPQSVTVLEGRKLAKARGQNFAATLENTPGVTTLKTGAGTAKPVIRGLTGQRVLVMTDGIRQEEQQFGDDHSVDLDSFGLERIEVVRGPASVLYGSDALGGVVNVIRAKAPTYKENSPLLGGSLTTNSFSNNKQDATAFSLFGYTEKIHIGYRISMDTRKAGKITTPNKKLTNTGFLEKNINGSIGMDGSWGKIYLDSFQRFQEQDLYENPNENFDPTAKPLQKIIHQKNHINGFLYLPIGNLEMDLGYQRNNRREVPDKNKYKPIENVLTDPTVDDFAKAYNIYQVNENANKQGLNLSLDTTTVEVKFHQKEFFGFSGTIGAFGMSQKSATIGTESLIPAYILSNVGLFLLEEYKIKSFSFFAGARVDKRIVQIEDNTTLNTMDQSKFWISRIGNLGAVWRLRKYLSVGTNLARGYRTPTVFELSANGEHEGTGRYEVGNNNLKPEYSQSYDGFLRFSTRRIQTEFSVFKNKIENYIYSQNSGLTEANSGLPIYRYRQDEAVITGGEWNVEFQTTKWLVLTSGIDVVHGTVKKTVSTNDLFNDNKNLGDIYYDLENKNIPRIPANRGRLGLKLTSSRFLKLKNPYFSLNGNFYRPQYQVDLNETKTKGYNLYDLALGFNLPWGFTSNGDSASFDMSVENVLNTQYVSHLSRYKSYALDPGINLIFKINVPFDLVK